MYKAYAYIKDSGIMMKEDYPYIGKEGECKYDEKKTVFRNLGMIQEESLSNEDLKAIVSRQPVGVGIVSNPNF
jgi:hypothetical protein